MGLFRTMMISIRNLANADFLFLYLAIYQSFLHLDKCDSGKLSPDTRPQTSPHINPELPDLKLHRFAGEFASVVLYEFIYKTSCV